MPLVSNRHLIAISQDPLSLQGHRLWSDGVNGSNANSSAVFVPPGLREVWVGPLAENKWAVALLNRHILANASITLDWAMLNVSATASFDVRDIWEGKDLGKMTGKFVANVKPRAVTYLLLTPS